MDSAELARWWADRQAAQTKGRAPKWQQVDTAAGELRWALIDPAAGSDHTPLATFSIDPAALSDAVTDADEDCEHCGHEETSHAGGYCFECHDLCPPEPFDHHAEQRDESRQDDA